MDFIQVQKEKKNVKQLSPSDVINQPKCYHGKLLSRQNVINARYFHTLIIHQVGLGPTLQFILVHVGPCFCLHGQFPKQFRPDSYLLSACFHFFHFLLVGLHLYLPIVGRFTFLFTNCWLVYIFIYQLLVGLHFYLPIVGRFTFLFTNCWSIYIFIYQLLVGLHFYLPFLLIGFHD